MDIYEDDVQENDKKDTIHKTGSDEVKDDYSESKPSLIKTKYDEGIDRNVYTTDIKNEETCTSLNSPFSSFEEGNEKKSIKNESLTSIEIRRLEEINGRSMRLVFSERPSVQCIMDICSDILSIAKFGAHSCFCIFADYKSKELAEKLFGGLKFRSGYIIVDSHRQMVPVDTQDMEITRDLSTLAVHGIPREVTADDLWSTFPGAKNVKIAHRGGSAFITYTDNKTCSAAFIEAEDVRVGGQRVQVLFGHGKSKYGNIENPSNRISIESPFPNCSPVPAVTKTELIFSSQQQLSQSARTPAKLDFETLFSALDGSGLKVDELQADYMRGVCEPGSGPGIRTSWIDRLKGNADNKLSRSYRMDLVIKVWNFFEEDPDTQQRLKTEKKIIVKKLAKRIIRQEKGSSPERKKHCRREIKYDSPSPSVKSEIVEKKMDEKDRKLEIKKEEYTLLINHIKTDSSLEKAYLRQFTHSTDSGKLRERLASLLSEAGFSSFSEITPNLAAGLSLNFFNSNPTTQTKLAKWRQSSFMIEKKLEQLAKKEPQKTINKPHRKSIKEYLVELGHNVLEVSDEFSRMALEMAGQLADTSHIEEGQVADTSQIEEEKCKAMASEMVAVWIYYGLTYDDLAEMYSKQRKRDEDATLKDSSFLGMKKLLHSRLRKKVDEGHMKPKKFGFSMLIDATVLYFDKEQ